MRSMYSHPGEYRKYSSYLCIVFVPGGNLARSFTIFCVLKDALGGSGLFPHDRHEVSCDT